LLGCDGQSGAEGGKPAEARSEHVLAILAKADAVDGAEDHVVSKCLTCSLGMNGDTNCASQFGPYELHLCSKACKKKFDADPEEAVLKVKVPAAE